MPKVTIIIANYNTKEILKDCLAHLKNEDHSPLEVVVVDNASPDASADMVEKDFSWVRLIRSENKGISHAYNLAINSSPESDFYLFMGSDAFPEAYVINGMIEYLQTHKDVGAATCKLVLRDGNLDMDAHRGFPTPYAAITHFSGLDRVFRKSRIFAKYFIGWEDMTKPHEIDLAISHFLLVRRNVFDAVGLWDEDFFVFGEDVDMCWRIKQAGFKIMYLSQYKCLHYKGVSVGIRKESQDKTGAGLETKIHMTKETTRAMRLFYEKHMVTKYPRILNEIVILGISLMERYRVRKLKA